VEFCTLLLLVDFAFLNWFLSTFLETKKANHF